MVRTRIIATLGPSSSGYTVIRKMVISGLDVVRLNFSHGAHRDHLARIVLVRKINDKYRRHIRILQDLEGYRIRIGRFTGKDRQKILKKRAVIHLTGKPDNGDPATVPFDYSGDLRLIKTGRLIYIDDGNIVLKATGSSKRYVKTEVMEGGILKERKGINMPGLEIPFTGITDKDREDINFGITHKVDYITQSFVRTRKDVEAVRHIAKPALPECLIVAKVESREAIRNIDDIIDAADGIMIARGDMGIAVPIYEIPVIQKTIIKKCNREKKFVITATQMLEHMTEHSRPTRAEVTDVANAILDGTDFVMLSGETAVGIYPAEAVKMMNEIIKFTEAYENRVRRCGHGGEKGGRAVQV